jgi:hypothetical protein
MPTKVEIWNMAMLHLGQSLPIASETEKSVAARACARLYPTSVETVLTEGLWPFNMATVALGLIEERPNSEWGYAYVVPSDCLNPIRILSGLRRDTPDSRIEFKTAMKDGTLILYTDKEDAELEYGFRVTNESSFTAPFALAVSYHLAAVLAPSITAGDPLRLGARALAMYDAAMGRAQVVADAGHQAGPAADSEWDRARSS